MRKSFTRAVAGVTAFAAVASVGFAFDTASALPPGSAATAGLTLPTTSGTATSNFNLALASNGQTLANGTNTCPGDTTTNPAYRWATFMVPHSVDAGTLAFTSTGPTPPSAGVFTQPLFSNAGSPQVNKAPGLNDGLITPIPTFSFGALAGAGATVPNGAYDIGFACYTGGATAKYWETPITISNSVTNAGATTFNWTAGIVPDAPVLGALTPGDTTASGSFSAAASTPATTGYTVTAVPTSGPTVTLPVAAAGAFTLTGLVNGTQYSVTVTATNTVGTSVASNAVLVTPDFAPRPAITGLTATQSPSNTVKLTWNSPGDSPTNYTVSVSPAIAGLPTTTAALTIDVPGLIDGTAYTFSVTANYASAPLAGPAATVAFTYQGVIIIQDLTVVRPKGALVLTQRCGVYGSAPQVTDNVFGTLPALAASPANADPDPVNGYTYGGLPAGSPFGGQPSLTAGGSGDPLYAQYPYPVDANGNAIATYPTHCGIDLGTGKLITSGPKAGQYFTANGRMAQLTVVNTQDVDGGFTINGQMSTFAKNGTLGNTRDNSFSGNLLGWNPEVTYDSAPNLDGYDMVVVAGGVREPVATSSTTGLGAASNVGNTSLAQSLAKSNGYAQATNTGSLGMAVLDARLRLLIPVSADNGTYTGTLTFTTI